MKSPNDPTSQFPNDPIAQSPNNLPIVFFGSSKFVIPIIEVLRKNFDLSLVLTTEKNPTAAVPTYCVKNKIPYLSVSNLSDPKVKSQLSNVNCQLAVLADFGLIIPPTILNLFPKGIINIHPSLLPKYRGPTPVQTAILNGDKVTGVSIMKLDDKVDHGPILAQTKEQILENDTAESLCERLFKKGTEILVPIIRIIELNQPVSEIPQDHSKTTFTNHLTRQDGFVDLSSLEIRNSKLEIARKIRAYYPWPGVWFRIELNGRHKIIKLLPNNLIAQYPNDQILIQVEGKKPVDIETFKRGYPETRQWLEKLLE